MRRLASLVSLVSSYLLSTVTSQSTSDPYSGASIGSKYPLYNLTQKLDHGNASSTATFQQRFQVVTDYFKPGGPLLFHQGAEGVMTAVENTLFYEWAEELEAIVVSIEHRFFGASLPKQFDGSPSSFAPLTLENVLDDAIVVANFVKKNATGAANSKVILQGGVYQTLRSL